jgi:hypothetical protein
MPQSELLKKVVAALETANTPYMLTGSYASSLQGEPRLTHDTDIVVSLSNAGARALLEEFHSPDYYLDELVVYDAIKERGQFNLLEISSGDKVDFWLLTDEAFDQSRFDRRSVEEFEGLQLFVSRPEDTILMKLRWAKLSGGSQKQMRDARSVLELQMPNLDLAYINRWAHTLDVEDLWDQIRGGASGGRGDHNADAP